MVAPNPDRKLRIALEAFETSLATPIVSGELAPWSEQVQRVWAELCPLVQYQVTALHPKQFQEITDQDPELFAQVDNMKAEDAHLEENRKSLDQLIQRLANLAPLVEPDERRFHDYMAQLQKEAIDYMARVKKQLVAVQTWYVEAFNRDRGIAD